MNYMLYALKEAKKAFFEDEVPVGAVIVRDKEIISSSHNTCEKECSALAHAEINAINQAQKKLGRKILDDCEIYVTVEPCAMCAGAICNTRIKRVYIGCAESKTGAFGSSVDLGCALPHRPEIYFGFCEEESKKLMQDFFSKKR